MSMNTKISQGVVAYIEWKKLSKDIKKEFNIANDEKDIEIFLSNNEKKYLKSEVCEGDFKMIYTNDITGEEFEEKL